MEVNVANNVADCGAFCFPMQIGNELFCAFVFAAMIFHLALFAPYNEALTFL